MSDTERSLNEELEDSLESTLDSLNRILCLRESLSESLKEGWFQIVRTRYSMGPNAITQFQYDESDQEAFSTLHLVHDLADSSTRNGDLDGGAEYQGSSHTDNASATTHGGEGSTESDSHSSMSRCTLELKSIGNESGRHPTEQGDEKSSKVKAGSKNKDKVLRWFGALTPPSLKIAQSSFLQALETCVHLANEQNEFVQRHGQFLSLKRKGL